MKQINKLKQRKKAAVLAVTLTEMMISMALFAIGAISIFGGISTSFAVVKTSREDLRATQIMLDKMETIRLYTWQQINTPGFVPTNYIAYYDGELSDTNYNGIVYQGTLDISPYSATYGYHTNLVTVSTRLEWTQNGIIRDREMKSLVARNGLQEYVY